MTAQHEEVEKMSIDPTIQALQENFCGLPPGKVERILELLEVGPEKTRLIMATFDPVLSKRVDELKLSVRLATCLRNDGIIHVRDLIRKSQSEMLRLPNFGRITLAELNEVLAQMGLRLADKDSAQPQEERAHQGGSAGAWYAYADHSDCRAALAIVASIGVRFGAPIEVIRRALTRYWQDQARRRSAMCSGAGAP
jgi:hypothetical protein